MTGTILGSDGGMGNINEEDKGGGIYGDGMTKEGNNMKEMARKDMMWD